MVKVYFALTESQEQPLTSRSSASPARPGQSFTSQLYRSLRGPIGAVGMISLLLCAVLASRAPRGLVRSGGGGGLVFTTNGPSESLVEGALNEAGAAFDLRVGGPMMAASGGKFATNQFNARLEQYYMPLTERTEQATLDNSWPRTRNISLGLDKGANGTLEPGRFSAEDGPIQVGCFENRPTRTSTAVHTADR